MSLLLLSSLTATDLANRLSMDVEDDSTGLALALEAAASDIEPHVQIYSDILPVPAGLKVAILDIAATRYERTNLRTSEQIGSVRNEYANEYETLLERIAPYRSWPGL